MHWKVLQFSLGREASDLCLNLELASGAFLTQPLAGVRMGAWLLGFGVDCCKLPLIFSIKQVELVRIIRPSTILTQLSTMVRSCLLRLRQDSLANIPMALAFDTAVLL